METRRLVINDCNQTQMNNFTARLKGIKELCFKGCKPSSDAVLQDRYYYTCEYDNISIVYETKSHTLIITAAEHLLLLLKEEFEKAQKPQPEKSRPKTTQASKKAVTAKAPVIQAPITQSQPAQVPAMQTPAKQIVSKQNMPKQALLTPKQQPKAKIMPQAKKDKTQEIEKKLKKLFPNAYNVLNEQSRVDFTIGLLDINNNDVKLSDYSMLLVPPFRGLERLIYDLQKARGIEVKMIGQAYEKQEGRYVLKSGYRKRVGSIVYNEVMGALYTEYFEKRNFYAHSDITGDLLSRVITDKEAVKNIFNRLVELIEYNVTKLKEISFWDK